MHHLIKILAIAAMFTPFIYFSLHLLGAHSRQVDVLNLALSEQVTIMALLLLPAFAMRYLHLLPKLASPPHPME